VKVLGMRKAVLNANDKIDEEVYENDIKEEDVVNDDTIRRRMKRKKMRMTRTMLMMMTRWLG